MLNPSPLPYHCLEQIRTFAFTNPDVETCGYVFADGEVWDVPNASTEPSKSFKIDAETHLSALKHGKIAAIWHTHLDMQGLSGADLRASTQLKIPYLCFSLGNSQMHWFDPNHVKPLIGRLWKNPETNCGTLVADYFREQHGIHFEFIPLDEARLNDPEYSPVLDDAERLGFNILPFVVGDLRNSDVIVFRCGTPNPMHVGVMTDVNQNQFLHHPINQLSRYEVLGGYWIKSAAKILRWRDFG